MKNYTLILCFLLAFTVSKLNAQTYYKLNFSNHFNFNLNTEQGGNFASMPTGSNVMFDSVPFHIYPWTDSVNGWNANSVGGSNPIILRIPCNKTITGLNLLSNTYWGKPGPTSYASVQFWHSGKKVFEKMLIGNVDIRDHLQNIWTNTINKTTTTNAWAGPGSHRSDNIHIVLPSSIKIDSILVVDNGGYQFSRIFVLAATAEISVKPGIKPGSGNSVVLTETGSLATSPYIYAGSGLDFGNESFTCEAWVKRDSIKNIANGKSIIQGDLNNSWGIGFMNNNTVYFTAVGINNVTSATTLIDNQWHHIAVVYTGSQILFYIDGFLSGNPSYNHNFNNTSGDYIIGPRQTNGISNGDQTLDGHIDELRIWNKALTQTQIRSRMCQKIKTSDPLYSNLVRYYNFDESNGKTVFDYSKNAQNGTFINNPARVLSGSPIGDASAYTYGGNSVNLKNRNGENLKVDKIKGTPASIHLYRVDDKPSIKKGIKGLGPNKTYFGVFPFKDSSIKYRVTYNYTGSPYVIEANEDALQLYTRTSNADRKWINSSSVLDTATNTLITDGDSSAEYILGSTGEPLQVPKLVSINDTTVNEGNAGNKTIKIPVVLNESAVFNSSVNYATEDSTATAGQDYVSKSGTINFAVGQLTDTIKIVIKGDTKVEQNEVFKVVLSNPVNISIADTAALVTIKDNDAANFAISNAAENNNALINKSSFSISPNPTKDFINIVSPNNIAEAQVQITDMNGKTLYNAKQSFIANQQLKINVSQFSKQVLIVIIENKDHKEKFKVVKE